MLCPPQEWRTDTPIVPSFARVAADGGGFGGFEQKSPEVLEHGAENDNADHDRADDDADTGCIFIHRESCHLLVGAGLSFFFYP
ncbi:hypothetical protein AA13755_0437 [Acetobacter peroxydans NBRC 13755]|nr:hypothetical protein AA13755_0437 [Acetobacter peroxydans NBRC 13755]